MEWGNLMGAACVYIGMAYNEILCVDARRGLCSILYNCRIETGPINEKSRYTDVRVFLESKQIEHVTKKNRSEQMTFVILLHLIPFILFSVSSRHGLSSFFNRHLGRRQYSLKSMISRGKF